MADYFSTLASRTLGKLATVRPLIAPRYARQMWSGEAPSMELRSVEGEAQTAARPEPAEAVDRPRNTLVQEEAPRRVTEQRQAIPEATLPTETPFHLISPVEETDSVRRTPRQSAPPSEAQSSIAQPRPAAPETKTVIQQEPGWRLLPLVPDRQPTAIDSSPMSNLNSPPGEARTQQKLSSPEAPVIHVSIGRIDVRAVMPQTETTGAQAPPARRSTLEKYLRERNGERR